jgi:uncharacterized protein YjiS (DUF1127 family)
MLARAEWIAEHPIPSKPTRSRASHRVAEILRVWRDRIRDREGMANLTERDLRDARLTRTDVQAEIAKPFWRA